MSKIIIIFSLILIKYNINGKLITNMCGNIGENDTPTELSDCKNGYNEYRGKCCLITFYNTSGDILNETNYKIINRNCISVNSLNERELKLIEYLTNNSMKINIDCYCNKIYNNIYILFFIIIFIL